MATFYTSCVHLSVIMYVTSLCSIKTAKRILHKQRGMVVQGVWVTENAVWKCSGCKWRTKSRRITGSEIWRTRKWRPNFSQNIGAGKWRTEDAFLTSRSYGRLTTVVETSRAVDIITTVYYIHGPWRDRNNFCCFICVNYGPYKLL